MKFLCERCGTRYSIADEKVRQKILKIRCKSCDNVITLKDSSAADAPAADAVVAQSAPKAPAAAKPSAPKASTSVPSLPRPPAPVERADWHMAVDGQQSGPFTKTQLVTQVLGQPPGAEVFLWKDGMDGWKEPSKVPEIDRALATAKMGRSVPPMPPPPKSKAAAAQSLASLAQQARPAGRAQSAAAADHLASFDEGEATQIQPLSASLAADLAASNTLMGGQNDDKTPIADVSAMGLEGYAESPKATGHKNGAKLPTAPSSAELFGEAKPSFFPPPATQEPPGQGAVAPAPLAPYMSAGESGLSKVMGLGGRYSRKPALKYGAAAAALLLVGAAVTLAFMGGGSATGLTGAGNRPGSPTDKNDPRTPEEIERAAAAEAQKWFPEDQEEPSVAHVGSDPAAKAPAPRKPGARPTVKDDPTAPPPLAPPAAKFPGEAAPSEERKVAALPGLQERRAVLAKKAAAHVAPVDQSAIRAVVTRKDNQDAVKLCYNRVLRQTGSRTGGRIEVVVTIGVSGRVKEVNLTSPAALDIVHACLKTAISRWRFPAGGEDYGTGFVLVLSGT